MTGEGGNVTGGNGLLLLELAPILPTLSFFVAKPANGSLGSGPGPVLVLDKSKFDKSGTRLLLTPLDEDTNGTELCDDIPPLPTELPEDTNGDEFAADIPLATADDAVCYHFHILLHVTHLM
jgi:hypothetical protein